MVEADGDMDDLLDEVLDAFDQQRGAQQPSSSSAAEPVRPSSSSHGFDPLGMRKGKRAPQKAPAPNRQSTFDPLGRRAISEAASLDDELSNLAIPPDLEGLTQQLAGLMAEFAKEEGDGNFPGSEASQNDISSTLQALADQARSLRSDGGGAAGGPPGPGCLDDSMLRQLTDGFDGLGEEPQMQSLVDSIMTQLLSKDVLYQPMKDIGRQYPAWLEKNKGTLSQEDWLRYNQQYEYIQQICKQYEEQPNDFQQLITLLQQMQQCGQPPQDIVQELAPGLEFDADGLPKVGGDHQLPPGLAPDMANCVIQ